MTEKEQFEFLLKIGYKMNEAIETIKKITIDETDSHDNSSYLNENESEGLEPAEDKNALKSSSRASESDLEKMLNDMKEELKTLRETIHVQNRKNAVIETANSQPKTVEENIEELFKSLEG